MFLSIIYFPFSFPTVLPSGLGDWESCFIAHHSSGGSGPCVFSLKRPFPWLCHISRERKGLGRQDLGWSALYILWFVILSKLPFPSDLHPLCLGQVSSFATQEALILHQAYCQESLSIVFITSLGRTAINANNSSHWPSHEAPSPFQEGLDASYFSISQLRPLFDSPTTNQMCPEHPPPARHWASAQFGIKRQKGMFRH